MGEEGGVHCTFLVFPVGDLDRSFFFTLLVHGPLFPALELDHAA